MNNDQEDSVNAGTKRLGIPSVETKPSPTLDAAPADCYIAIKPCGDASAILVDRAEYKRETAKTVGGWLREGYKVERVTRDEGVARLQRCDHGVIKEQLKRQATSG